MRDSKQGLTVAHLLLLIAGLAVILGAFRAHFSLGSFAFGIISLAWVRTSKIQRAWGRMGFSATARQSAGLFLQSAFAAAALLIGTFVMGACGLVIGSLFVYGPRLTMTVPMIMAGVVGYASCWFLRVTLWDGCTPDPPWPTPTFDNAPEELRPLAKLVGYDPSRYHDTDDPPNTDATRRPDP